MEIFNNQSIPFINADFTAKGREQENRIPPKLEQLATWCTLSNQTKIYSLRRKNIKELLNCQKKGGNFDTFTFLWMMSIWLLKTRVCESPLSRARKVLQDSRTPFLLPWVLEICLGYFSSGKTKNRNTITCAYHWHSRNNQIIEFMHIAHALYIWNKQHKKRTRHISLTFLQHMNYRCNQHLEQLIRLPRGRRCCLTFGYIFSLSSHIVLKYKDFVFKNSWSKLS